MRRGGWATADAGEPGQPYQFVRSDQPSRLDPSGRAKRAGQGVGLTGSLSLRPPRGGALRVAALLAVLFFMLFGCGVGDYIPWPGSGGGGRSAPAQRPRTSAPSPSSSPSPSPQSSQDSRPAQTTARWTALRGAEAQQLARQLSPASQSLRSFTDLAVPLRYSLAHLSRMPQNAPALVQPGGSLSWGTLRQSAEELLALLPALDANPGLLAERFVWYELAPAPLLTGYYSPEMDASLTRAPGYDYPLYAPPPDLAAHPGDYPRSAVDQGRVLGGRGLELAWLRNPADPFLMQTEGGGSLRLPDGSMRGVHFAGGNGLPFKGLGQILLDAGALPKERLNRESIRSWCAANPARALELMAANQSYVFFRFTQAASEGSLGKPLTPLVSLATDPSLLPLGAVAALDAPLPVSSPGIPSGQVQAGSLRGIVLAQDCGADIQGLRLDLYLGGGEQAELLVANFRTPAAVRLLVSKRALRARQ